VAYSALCYKVGIFIPEFDDYEQQVVGN